MTARGVIPAEGKPYLLLDSTAETVDILGYITFRGRRVAVFRGTNGRRDEVPFDRIRIGSGEAER